MKHISGSLLNQNNDKQLELIQFVGIIGPSLVGRRLHQTLEKRRPTQTEGLCGVRWGCKVGSRTSTTTTKWKTVYDDPNDFILIERNCAQKIDIHTVSHWSWAAYRPADLRAMMAHGRQPTTW